MSKLDFPAPHNPKTPIVNGLYSLFLAMSDIIQFEAEKLDKVKSLNNRFGIDNVTFKNYTLEVPKDKDCSFCSEENK